MALRDPTKALRQERAHHWMVTGWPTQAKPFFKMISVKSWIAGRDLKDLKDQKDKGRKGPKGQPRRFRERFPEEPIVVYANPVPSNNRIAGLDRNSAKCWQRSHGKRDA